MIMWVSSCGFATYSRLGWNTVPGSDCQGLNWSACWTWTLNLTRLLPPERMLADIRTYVSLAPEGRRVDALRPDLRSLFVTSAWFKAVYVVPCEGNAGIQPGTLPYGWHIETDGTSNMMSPYRRYADLPIILARRTPLATVLPSPQQ